MAGARGSSPAAIGQRCIAPGLRCSSRVVAMELAHVFRSGLLLALLGVGVAAAAPPEAPLADGAKRGDWAAVRTLVEAGAEVNARQGDGSTALHWASYRDNREIAALLVRAGAEVNATNDLGATPLWAACENGSSAMVTLLLEAGADPNRALPFGETPLMTAARAGNADAVGQLLSAGADVDAATEAGTHGAQTALMWAVAQAHPAVVEVLLAHGADVHARSTTFTETVKTIPTYANYGLQCVPRDECYITDVRSGGFTPLLFAARVGDLASARLLAAAGADVNEAAPDGASALAVAALSGHGAVAAFLLDRGADPNAAEGGYAPLHAAILHRDARLAEALLSAGADPHARVSASTRYTRDSADFFFPSVVRRRAGVLAGGAPPGRRHDAPAVPARRRSAGHAQPGVLDPRPRHRRGPHVAGGRRDDRPDGGGRTRRTRPALVRGSPRTSRGDHRARPGTRSHRGRDGDSGGREGGGRAGRRRRRRERARPDGGSARPGATGSTRWWLFSSSTGRDAEADLYRDAATWRPDRRPSCSEAKGPFSNKSGGPRWDRTSDTLIKSQVLYH